MMNMIRKGQVRWLPKGDIAGQVAFIAGRSDSPLLPNSITSGQCSRVFKFATLPLNGQNEVSRSELPETSVFRWKLSVSALVAPRGTS